MTYCNNCSSYICRTKLWLEKNIERRYINHIKNEVEKIMSTTSDAYVKKQPGNIVEKLNVLEQDGVHAMKEQLPALYCKIVGRYSGFVIGKRLIPTMCLKKNPIPLSSRSAKKNSTEMMTDQKCMQIFCPFGGSASMAVNCGPYFGCLSHVP